MEEHKIKFKKDFASKYNVNKLVYYEVFDNISNAILREKQLKVGSRKRKIELIEIENPEWRDLSDDLD
jgi:putative endonuclease